MPFPVLQVIEQGCGGVFSQGHRKYQSAVLYVEGPMAILAKLQMDSSKSFCHFFSMEKSLVETVVLPCSKHKRKWGEGISLFTSFIFAADNIVHFLRRFFASAGKPHFHDCVEAAFKKFNVIGNMLIIKMTLGLVRIIINYLLLIIISEFEIGAIEQLIFFDVTKQL